MRYLRCSARILSVVLISLTAGAQDKPAKDTSKTQVKSDSVTINLPEGMTKDQADAILNELRQIRQLLEKQQSVGLPAREANQSAAPSGRVSMTIDPGWYAIGRSDAPLTLVEFDDYECSYCRRFHTETFTALKKNYIDTGKVRFINYDLPLDYHPYSFKAAEAAQCAGDQGKFWEMRDALFSHADDLAYDSIIKYAQALSLETKGFRACLDSDKYKPELQRNITEAGGLAIFGTPTFVLGKVVKDSLDGKRIVGAVPYSVFESLIKKSLGEN